MEQIDEVKFKPQPKHLGMASCSGSPRQKGPSETESHGSAVPRSNASKHGVSYHTSADAAWALSDLLLSPFCSPFSA
eukprot:2843627-Amphidinium_carterae.1